MADPRQIVSFEGIDEVYATFTGDGTTIVYTATAANGSTAVGLAVYLTGASTVSLTQDATAVLGKLTKVEVGNKCTVQIEGGCKLPAGNAAAVTAGSRIVGALGAASARGYIRNLAPAVLAEVATSGSGIIYDASDTTNVVVMF